jgi:hypothetical protein
MPKICSREPLYTPRSLQLHARGSYDPTSLINSAPTFGPSSPVQTTGFPIAPLQHSQHRSCTGPPACCSAYVLRDRGTSAAFARHSVVAQVAGNRRVGLAHLVGRFHRLWGLAGETKGYTRKVAAGDR